VRDQEGAEEEGASNEVRSIEAEKAKLMSKGHGRREGESLCRFQFDPKGGELRAQGGGVSREILCWRSEKNREARTNHLERGVGWATVGVKGGKRSRGEKKKGGWRINLPKLWV